MKWVLFPTLFSWDLDGYLVLHRGNVMDVIGPVLEGFPADMLFWGGLRADYVDRHGELVNAFRYTGAEFQ